MKRLLNIALIALTLTVIGTVDAKMMKYNKSAPKEESSARQISKASDAVKDAVKNVQTAPTENKAIAKQEANDAVADLLATIQERTWMEDLRCYSEDQVK